MDSENIVHPTESLSKELSPDKALAFLSELLGREKRKSETTEVGKN